MTSKIKPVNPCDRCFKEMNILCSPPHCECPAEVRIRQGVYSESTPSSEELDDSSKGHSPTPSGIRRNKNTAWKPKYGVFNPGKTTPKFSCTMKQEVEARFKHYIVSKSIYHPTAKIFEVRLEDMEHLLYSIIGLINETK